VTLSDRLARARGEEALGPDPARAARAADPAPEASGLATRVATAVAATDDGRPASPTVVAEPSADGLTRLKERAGQALFERLGTKLSDPDLPEQQLHVLVRAELQRVIANEQAAPCPRTTGAG